MTQSMENIGERIRGAFAPRTWTTLQIALILAAGMAINADSHSPRKKRFAVLVNPFTEDGQLSPLFISILAVIVVTLCVVLLIAVCTCFRLHRRLIETFRSATARHQSYHRMSGDLPGTKNVSSFDLIAERRKFSSANRTKHSTSDSLKKTAEDLTDRLNWIDHHQHRKYSGGGSNSAGGCGPPTYEHAVQIGNSQVSRPISIPIVSITRRDSDSFDRIFKQNVEKSNGFRPAAVGGGGVGIVGGGGGGGGDGVKMSEELMRQYRERKLLSRRKYSSGSNDFGQQQQRKITAVRKYSGDHEMIQRKLLAMKKFAAAAAACHNNNNNNTQINSNNNDLYHLHKAAALRRLPGCGSDGDLCRWSAPANRPPNRPRLKKLAGHASFLTYEYEDRFSSPWEARARLLDPRRSDELASMSECELDGYCIYFNVEEWQQIKCRWNLARNCRTIDEEQSEEQESCGGGGGEEEKRLEENDARSRCNTLGNVRRPSFRAMLKTVPYAGESVSRQHSAQTRQSSEEDEQEADKEEQQQQREAASMDTSMGSGSLRSVDSNVQTSENSDDGGDMKKK